MLLSMYHESAGFPKRERARTLCIPAGGRVSAKGGRIGASAPSPNTQTSHPLSNPTIHTRFAARRSRFVLLSPCMQGVTRCSLVNEDYPATNLLMSRTWWRLSATPIDFFLSVCAEDFKWSLFPLHLPGSAPPESIFPCFPGKERPAASTNWRRQHPSYCTWGCLYV